MSFETSAESSNIKRRRPAGTGKDRYLRMRKDIVKSMEVYKDLKYIQFGQS
jgi:hypothetical protein